VKKSFLFSLLILSILVTMLAGTASAQDDPVVITMWHIATEADSFYSVLPPAIDNFNATHDDVQIEVTVMENDAFKTQIAVAVAAGEQPDIFMTWGGGLLKSYVDAGIVREIPELDTEAGANFIPGGLGPSTFDSKHYAVPANLAGIGLYYNKALFAEADLDAPATWDDLIASCAVFNEMGVAPISLGNVNRWTGSFWFMYLNLRTGGPEAFQAAYGRTGSFADPTFVKTGELIQQAVEAECFIEGYNGMNYQDEQVLFASGLAAMELQGDWNYAGLLNLEMPQEDIGFIPFPAVSEDGDELAMLGGTGQAFTISSKAPEETNMVLIELLGSPEFGLACAENGFLPAVKGAEDRIEDPLVKDIAGMLSEASYVQLAYDQFLPPELAQVHLDTTQALFGLSMSPEEAAETMEAAAASAQ